MAVEIERKFLVDNDDWRAAAGTGTPYRQGYLSTTAAAPGTGAPACSVRVRIAGTRAYLNIKSATVGLTRSEYDYPIPVPDAEEMLENLRAGSLVEKTRYLVDVGEHRWEIDVFEGDNRGLIVAEVELTREDEPFQRPLWLGKDVSADPRYYNARLAVSPYKDWSG